ncbi:hypothetical protein IMZ11_41410 [Microtetraspora sp. AC03309]|uniref:hypothetical protein n=1 Tax=Microtetraspora sp. AC03309 TaxID=2779376 RepID=UPI001E43C634|nr:hypothetical protein [Microtetraspora sp. AC03309]MCC5582075.1 hypothetical protein [Microtetraspora sp. AC03309]
MTYTLAQAVDDITASIGDADLETARLHFTQAVDGDPARLTDLVKRLAATVEIPKHAIIWGFGVDVWGNPHRRDYAWRCGDCPWTGSNYRTERGARSAATRHAGEHQAAGEPVPTVTKYAVLTLTR